VAPAIAAIAQAAHMSRNVTPEENAPALGAAGLSGNQVCTLVPLLFSAVGAITILPMWKWSGRGPGGASILRSQAADFGTRWGHGRL
jgi:hypothetical protein